MKNHFLENINIINYKCFKNFKLDELKRVNLISGTNNVGKTALLESLYVNVHSKNIRSLTHSLSSVKFMRNNLEFVTKPFEQSDLINCLESMDGIKVKSNRNDIGFSILEKEGIKKYLFNSQKFEIEVISKNFSFEEEMQKNISFIDNFGFFNQELKNAFEAVQVKDVESVLNSYITSFDSNILNFKIIGGDKPQCKISTGEYIDINEFGDGLKHYISIICALYTCEDGYLLIDEIDNGIHHTQLDKLWEIIFKISKEVNCQVFATTHSKEMIESFNRQDDGSGGFFELYKNPKKENAITYKFRDKEQLEYSLKNGSEFRGE